jgi:hypothetical protein
VKEDSRTAANAAAVREVQGPVKIYLVYAARLSESSFEWILILLKQLAASPNDASSATNPNLDRSHSLVSTRIRPPRVLFARAQWQLCPERVRSDPRRAGGPDEILVWYRLTLVYRGAALYDDPNPPSREQPLSIILPKSNHLRLYFWFSSYQNPPPDSFDEIVVERFQSHSWDGLIFSFRGIRRKFRVDDDDSFLS